MTEPYAWVDGDSRLQSKQTDIGDIPLYKKLPWQGLSEKEIDELTKNVIAFKSDIVDFIGRAEAKLKEKNT